MLLNKEYLLTFYSYQIIKKFHETFFTFLEAIQEAEADAVTHGGCGTIINYWMKIKHSVSKHVFCTSELQKHSKATEQWAN